MANKPDGSVAHGLRLSVTLWGSLPNNISREAALEQAVTFLVRALESRVKRGKKPVILHSLRVGFYLMNAGCSDDAVMAGMLHDVLEKTEFVEAHLAQRFNPRVAAIVAANTNDERIEGALARYADSISRCKEVGEDALLVRAADLIDNCDRALSLRHDGRLCRLAEKLRLLLQATRNTPLETTSVVEELARRSQLVVRRMAAVTLR